MNPAYDLTIDPFIRIDPSLLYILSEEGIDPNDAALAFIDIFDKVRTCESNYKFGAIVKDNVWILRDYFENTKVMFKLTAVYHSSEYQYRKDVEKHGIKWDNSPLVLNEYSPQFWVNIRPVFHKTKNRVYIPYSSGQEYAKKKVENILIGDNIKPKPFIDFQLKKQKRMFPKGYTYEKLKRTRKVKNESKSSK